MYIEYSGHIHHYLYLTQKIYTHHVYKRHICEYDGGCGCDCDQLVSAQGIGHFDRLLGIDPLTHKETNESVMLAIISWFLSTGN